MSSRIAALRLPGLGPRDLTGCGGDAESPVDVRSLQPGTPSGFLARPRDGILPSLASLSPTTSGLAQTFPVAQNEIKKAQNRKSAKRFREAQKRRWASLQEELASSRSLVAALRTELAAHNCKITLAEKRKKVDAMSINALVDGLPQQSPPCSSTKIADAESALYAHLLQSVSLSSGSCQPYVAELGVLERTLVVAAHNGAICDVRKGITTSRENNIFRDVADADLPELRGALLSRQPIAVGYVRSGIRYNAVIRPVLGESTVVLAEFLPSAV